MYKKNVQAALDALRDALVNYGANPFRIDLPRPAGVMKVGVDDFIKLHGKKAKQAFANLERVPLFLGTGISADELLLKDIEPIRWVIPGLIPVGLTFLAGKPKIGKSWLVLALVVAIASGRRALNFYDTEAAEVLYLALEDSERRLKDRLKKVAPNLAREDARRLEFHITWKSVDEQGLLALERRLAKNPACKAVFIDTFAKVRNTPKGGGSYYEDYEAVSALKKIADRFAIAIVVVHHVRKQGSDDPFEMISGTNGISGSADTNFVLIRERNNAQASLHVSGRDVVEQEIALTFDEGVWTAHGDAVPLRISSTHQEIVLAMVQVGRPMSSREIAQETDRKQGGIGKTLNRMVRDGIILRTPDGKYVPASKQVQKRDGVKLQDKG
ncbi:MAG: AAA family ATPase [Alphaproteobacteria bacterium]